MIEITNKALDPEKITAKVRKDTNGGVVTFLGITRLFNDGRKVQHLEYEAYRPMADKKLKEIVQETKAKWGIEDVAIAHRIGRLAIGEISMVVAVGSPHRKEAFEAAQYVVDLIKDMVPIWKKEVFEGGEVWIGSQSEDPTHGHKPVSKKKKS